MSLVQNKFFVKEGKKYAEQINGKTFAPPFSDVVYDQTFSAQLRLLFLNDEKFVSNYMMLFWWRRCVEVFYFRFFFSSPRRGKAFDCSHEEEKGGEKTVTEDIFSRHQMRLIVVDFFVPW